MSQNTVSQSQSKLPDRFSSSFTFSDPVPAWTPETMERKDSLSATQSGPTATSATATPDRGIVGLPACLVPLYRLLDDRGIFELLERHLGPAINVLVDGRAGDHYRLTYIGFTACQLTYEISQCVVGLAVFANLATAALSLSNVVKLTFVVGGTMTFFALKAAPQPRERLTRVLTSRENLLCIIRVGVVVVPLIAGVLLGRFTGGLLWPAAGILMLLPLTLAGINDLISDAEDIQIDHYEAQRDATHAAFEAEFQTFTRGLRSHKRTIQTQQRTIQTSARNLEETQHHAAHLTHKLGHRETVLHNTAFKLETQTKKLAALTADHAAQTRTLTEAQARVTNQVSLLSHYYSTILSLRNLLYTRDDQLRDLRKQLAESTSQLTETKSQLTETTTQLETKTTQLDHLTQSTTQSLATSQRDLQSARTCNLRAREATWLYARRANDAWAAVDKLRSKCAGLGLDVKEGKAREAGLARELEGLEREMEGKQSVEREVEGLRSVVEGTRGELGICERELEVSRGVLEGGLRGAREREREGIVAEGSSSGSESEGGFEKVGESEDEIVQEEVEVDGDADDEAEEESEEEEGKQSEGEFEMVSEQSQSE